MKEPLKKRVGRPPAGLGVKGEPSRIRDYPTLLITMRPVTKARIKAIAECEGRPTWRVVEDAIQRYADGLPPKVRHAMEAIVRRGAVRETGTT